MEMEYYKQYEPIFGAWHIPRLIGEGSFGKVYEIEREDFGITYKAALKAITVPENKSEVISVLSEGMDEKSAKAYFGSVVQELVKEFALMSKLKGNSNVVSYENHVVIQHKEEIGWDILIQMELLTPLNTYIKEHKTISRQEVIRLGIDICKALELCQKHNIIHRDIKPENIFVSENDDFKLGDFGIARTMEKSADASSKKGTYGYMAPEVYKGEKYNSTVDLYSLGMVLYRLMNGNRLPFYPAAPAPITYPDRNNAMVKRLSNAPMPKPCHADGRLAEIILKACAYDPKDRYSSPLQMRQELEAILYNREEAKLIYPDGDEVPQDSARYVEDETSRGGDSFNGTVSNFGKEQQDAEYSGTVSNFGKKQQDAEYSGTVGNFGGKTPEAAEEISGEADEIPKESFDDNRTVSHFKKGTEDKLQKKAENKPAETKTKNAEQRKKEEQPPKNKKKVLLICGIAAAVLLIVILGIVKIVGIINGNKAVQDASTLTVAIPELGMPVSYDSGNGLVLGYYKDVTEAVAKEMGYRADFKLVNKGTQQQALIDGEADFTISYDTSFFGTTGGQCCNTIEWEDNRSTFLAAANSKAAAATWEEIKESNYLIGYVTGYLEHSTFKKSYSLELITPVEIDSLANALEALRTGGIDLLYINEDAAAEMTEAYSDLVSTGIPVDSMEYFTTLTENMELIEKLNQAITTLSANGTLDSIRAQYELSLNPRNMNEISNAAKDELMSSSGNSNPQADGIARIGILAPGEYGRPVFNCILEQKPTVTVDGTDQPVELVFSDVLVNLTDSSQAEYCKNAAQQFISAGCDIVCEIWADNTPSEDAINTCSEMLKHAGIPLISYRGWNVNYAYGINKLENKFADASLATGVMCHAPKSVALITGDAESGTEAANECMAYLDNLGISYDWFTSADLSKFEKSSLDWDMIFISNTAPNGREFLHTLAKNAPDSLMTTAVTVESSACEVTASGLGFANVTYAVQTNYNESVSDADDLFDAKFLQWLMDNNQFEQYVSFDNIEIIRDSDYTNYAMFTTAVQTLNAGGDPFEMLGSITYSSILGSFYFEPSGVKETSYCVRYLDRFEVSHTSGAAA